MVASVERKPSENNGIASVMHPEYSLWSGEWRKWRLTYEGGERFINTYLHHYSHREDPNDFSSRKKTTYNPAFAKGCINDIKDSIYSRMKDITRIDGSQSYQQAILGLDGGVDLMGSSMNSFVGQKVLPELLVMAKVGVYVDKEQLNGPTIADNLNNHPYLYYYKAEDIRSWAYDSRNQLVSLLLCDYVEQLDEETELPCGTVTRYRLLKIDPEDGFVYVRFYDDSGNRVDPYNTPSDDFLIRLNIKEIPFAIAGLSSSLLTDIADYQIGLLNLASANLSYALKSNFPFYTEQFDQRSESPYIKNTKFEGEGGVEEPVDKPPEMEVSVGSTTGRRYPKGLDRPGFIHPSPEPLKASMALGTEMKHDMRQLLNLTLSALEPKFASAESKDKDQRGLESGLSYIGLELQNLERKIAYFWGLYEGGKKIATVNYPEQYALISQEDIGKISDNLMKLIDKIPSTKAKKEICKMLAKINIAHKVTYNELQAIYTEIEKAGYIDSNPQAVQQDVINGLVDLVTASTARGYDGEKVVPVAKKEHAEKQAEIAKAQTKARTQETDPNVIQKDNEGKKERGPGLGNDQNQE